MIIDYSYFFGDCSIGQLSDQPVQDKLNWFIEQYEPELLRGLLGYETYKTMSSASSTQKWKDIINGVEYTDAVGALQKWRGLKYKGSDVYVGSPIAYYVYYWYQRSQVTNTGGVTEGKNVSQNAIPANPATKMVRAWNKMVDINAELYDFLRANKTVYPEWYSWALRDHSNVKFLVYINEFNI